MWEVEYTDEFGAWWGELTSGEQEVVRVIVDQLVERGPHLEFPLSSSVRGSRFGVMRELRAQYRGRPYRVLYAFDPRRTAILLLGGDKTGDDRWYSVNVPLADDLFGEHLLSLKREGGSDG